MNNIDKSDYSIEVQSSYYEFWENICLDKSQKHDIYHDFISSAIYKKNTIHSNINNEINIKLNNITNGNELLEYIIFVAALSIHAYRCTNYDENIIGIAAYTSECEYESSMKNSILPLKVNINDEVIIRDLIMELQKNMLAIYENQYCDLNKVLENINICKNIMDITSINITMNTIHHEKYINEIVNSDRNQITICIEKNFDELSFLVVYNERLYERETIKRFAQQYITIINEILNEPDKKIKNVEIFNEEVKKKILYEYNNTKAEYSKDKTIQALFEEQVERTPNNIAIAFEDKQLTYKELNEKANSLARVIRNKGIKADSIVGIMVDRSLEMMIGIMGILKSGGAYLPIDPTYPKERIEYILKDSESNLLVSKEFLLKDINFSGQIIDLSNSNLFMEGNENLEIINNSNSLAYVIYTSGTTGAAKGVMIEHSSLNNYCNWFKEKVSLNTNDETIFLSSYVFDLGYTTLFTALLTGIKVNIASEDDYRNPKRIIEFIEQNITYIKITPSMFNMILNCDDFHKIFRNEKLRLIVLGGESINIKDIQRFNSMNMNVDIKIMNHYGPTESTIGSVSTWVKVEDAKYFNNIIGKPNANTKVYIVNKNMNLMPIGVPGELCISGDGLARGYLNKPELTSEKFIENPFELEQRVYKTGDLARWLPDGNIEFLGRIDHQVKIRGFRIEIGEIENLLLKHEHIREAVVIDRIDESDNKYLCAYVVSEEDIKVLEIREYLSNSLPEYMIPLYFKQLNKLPLTRNGKIDRKELPEPTREINTGAEYEEARNTVEERLVDIWSEVLGAEKISINDNFFDLGGDSIKAIRIISKLRRYNYDLEMKDLFTYKSIKGISNKVGINSSGISQETITGEVELTPIQRMFFDKKITNKHHWNQAVMLYNKKGFEERIVKNVFAEIIKHHDALRMIYKELDEKVLQINRGIDESLYDIEVINYKDNDYIEDMKIQCNRIQSSIDLVNGPLLKLGLFKTKQGDHLLIVIHHLIIDGVSWRIIFEDFDIGYKQALKDEPIIFQEKTNSFKDWGNYLKKQIENIDYWANIENTLIKELPYDKKCEKEKNKVKHCRSVVVEIDEKNTTDLLKSVNRAYNTEINDILLTSLGLTVKEWSGEENVLIELEGHGREKLEGDIDISRTIGWFTTKYPVILNIKKDDDIVYAIKNTKEIIRHIPNKGIGYGILKYMPNNKLKGNTNPQIGFNYLGQFDQEINKEVFEISHISAGESISMESEIANEISITAIVVNNKLTISITYNSMKYNESTMKRVSELYRKNLLNIILHCKNKVIVELTPSDFSDVKLTIQELDLLKEKYEKNKGLVIKDIYQLTPMQEGLLFNSLVDKMSTAYFEQTSYMIKGKFNLKVFEESLNNLIERYDILRTVFAHEHISESKQIVLQERKVKVYYKDISELEQENRELYIEKFELQDRKKGFSLSEDIAIRVSILKTSNEQYRLVWSSHHILMDGWCRGLIMKDFFKIYSSFKANKVVQLDTPALYVNYIKWLQEQEKDKASKYWEKYLQGYNNIIDVYGNKSAEREKIYIKKELNFIIGKDLTKKMKKISSVAQVTINKIIEGVWGTLLQKYNNTNDVVFGSVTSGRNANVKGIEKMVGLLINTIPVRIKVEKDTTFLQLIKNIQKSAFESNNYDYYPLSEIQLLSEVKQKLVSNILIFENYYTDKNLGELYNSESLGFTIEEMGVYEQTNYDFNIMISPGDELNVKILYNENKYDKKVVEKIKEHFENAIKSIVNNPEIKVSEIEIISNEEKNKLLFEFNNTKLYYPQDKTVNELFEEQVKKSPNNIAIVFNDKKLTYREINEKSNELANYLTLGQDTSEGAIVGIFMERSEYMIISILGVLKAGAAYVPIDPELPFERIKSIINDAEIKGMISTKKQIGKLNKLQWECATLKSYLCLDSEDPYYIENVEENKLMDEKLWEYIGSKFSSEIGSGGWISSYTGEELSEKEMEEYSNNTFNKVRPHLKPEMRVLEIGCSSGITMFRLAPFVEMYYATDLSKVIIEKNLKRIEKERINNIKLECLKAHEIDKVSEEKFDLIIINSVVQYFPGYNYLRDVIAKVIELLCDEGLIFIGDVMDMELKKDLIQSLEEFKISRPEFINKTKTNFDSELFIPRDFFKDLAIENAAIKKVEFSKKQYTIKNELTQFRYDVSVFIDKTKDNRIKEQKIKHQYGVNELNKYSNIMKPYKVSSNSLAYVIYTSGSTGKPKGVMIEHKALSNFRYAINEKIDFSQNKTIAALTTISFDIFILETVVPLSNGLTVVIADETTQSNPMKLSNFIVENDIEILQMTPSRMQMMISQKKLNFPKNVKCIMIGGEVLPEILLDDLKKITKARIYNMYGPTETTVWSTIKDLTNRNDINIGKPIANTYMYVVDKYKNLQPLGIPGELCISGDGLARGYINQMELTEEKFVQNPYDKGARMYCTGDLVKWLPDGNIQFLGRIDYQVKIRGYRIELGEIESIINRQDGVKESVVLVKGSNLENQYMCAYLVLNNTTVQDIKDSLKKKLPSYMIPTSYEIINKMPLTSNGKIDRQVLLNIKETKDKKNKIQPRNFHENIIADIWKKVLRVEDICIHDDFFEFGGTSINIIQIANHIKEEIEVDISVADLMVYKTIAEISEYIINCDNINKKLNNVFKINKSSSKRNIFIVHGQGGDIFYYRNLAKLLEDEYSVYGIQPKGLNGKEPFPNSYYEMMNDYVNEIRIVQSEGPYIIAGFCIGGHISYDLVNIFELQGDQVTALIELDHEAFIRKEFKKGIYLNKIILRVIETWRRIWKKDKAYTMDVFSKMMPKAKPMSKEKQMELLKDVQSLNNYFGVELMVNHNYTNLGFINTPALVIKAEDNQHSLLKKELWMKMVKGALEYYEVPGSHGTVLLPPNVDKVAEIIRTYLK